MYVHPGGGRKVQSSRPTLAKLDLILKTKCKTIGLEKGHRSSGRRACLPCPRPWTVKKYIFLLLRFSL
jgi:hypothetical protein